MVKLRNRLRRPFVSLLTFFIFCQFTNVSALAIPIKKAQNTLSLSRDFSPPRPEVTQREKSKLAKRLLQGEIIQPNAVRELNHSLTSIRDIIGKIETAIDRKENPAIQIKYLQVEYESLIHLDAMVRNNLGIRKNQLKNQNVSNAVRARADDLLTHYDKNINPLLRRLKGILKDETNAYEDRKLTEVATKTGALNSIRDFIEYFDNNVRIEPEKPELVPSPPAFRSSHFKPIKPNTSGKVVPAYNLQKSRKPIEITLEAIPHTATQTPAVAGTAASQSSIGILSVTPPNPEDLTETVDVVITQEMRDLVASLNDSPSRIYEWVKSNIKLEFYHGSMKGSRGTFMENAGNDIDTVSLLLALYRAAGVPCRYVTGTIELPIEKARNLTGVQDANNLGELIASAGIPGILIVSGTEVVAVRMEHTWAEALVDYDPYAGAKAGEGDLWVPLSPWYKALEWVEGEDLVGMSGFDANAFLEDFISSLKTESPVDRFKIYFEDYLKANHPGMNWQDGLRTCAIKPETFRTLPNTLNFEVISVNGEYAELPDSLRHKVTLSVPQVSLSHTLNLSEVVGKKVTFSYPPADAASKTLIDDNGGIENVNPLAVNLTPTIKIEGTPVATGTVVHAGYYHTLRTTFDVPGQGSDLVEYSVVSGAYYSVGLDPQFVSKKFLTGRIADYISTVGDTPENTDNMDDITGEALYLAAMKYFNDVNTGDTVFAQSLKDVFLKQTSGAITGKNLVVYTLFGTPSDLEPGGYFVDAKRNIYTPVSVTGDASQELDFMILGGYNSSFFEHDLFEDFFNLEAISTVKLLSLAADQGMPVYDIDSGNIATILPLLTIDSGTKSAIQSAVSAGHVVKVHQDTLSVKNWNGAGYIDRDPTTNAAGYIISGGWAGGSTIDAIKTWLGDKWGDYKDWLYAGDPVNISNGNLYVTEKDLAVPAIGAAVEITRYYNSLSDYEGPFGYGWSFTYNEKIIEDSIDESLTYKSGDGGFVRYAKNPDGTYLRPPGIFASLTKETFGYVWRGKDGVRHFFDTNGRLTDITDRNGNTLTFGYSGDSLTTITDPANRIFSLTYNADQRITGISAPGGNIWNYVYNGDDLVSATNNAGQTIAYTYYPDHKLSTITNPEGGTVTYDYYSDGMAHTSLFPNGGIFTFSYNQPLGITTVTDPEGDSTIYYYNQQGLTTGSLDPLGYEEIYEYDDNINKVKIVDKNGGIVKNTYDTEGNLISTSNQLNYTTTASHDPIFSQMTSKTDPNGNTTSYLYDASGNLVEETDSEGVKVEYEYYDNGLLNAIRQDGEIKTQYSYKPDGNVASITDAYGNISYFEYDDLGRMTEKTDALGNTTSFTLDPAGNIIATVDAEGNTTHFTYNRLNLRTSLTDANDNTTIYEYDNWGKLVKVTDPLGFEKTFSYNLNYDLSVETDKNGVQTSYTYDARRQIAAKAYSDNSTESFSYDANGNMNIVGTGAGKIYLYFDATNKLIRATDVLGQSVEYTYHEDGRRKSVIDAQGGTTQFEYYKNGLLKTIMDPEGQILEYFYSNKKVSKIAYPNNTDSNYEYNQNDQLVGLEIKRNGSEIISKFEYAFNAAGDIESITDGTDTNAYQYDNTHQLLRVDYADGTFEAFSYDPVGNRKTFETPSTSISYNYDANNRMISAGTSTYNYNRNGNQIAKTIGGVTTSFNYNAKNQLVDIQFDDGTRNQFSYDPLGRRIQAIDKLGNIQNFLYSENDILMELDDAGVVKKRYTNGLLGTGPVGVKDQLDQKVYFMRDPLLSVTELTDASGYVTASFRYNPFGSIRSASGIDDMGVPHRFNGKELDTDSGLLFYGARNYDPVSGRFITPDRFTYGPDDMRSWIPQHTKSFISASGAMVPIKLNPYAMAGNNPINNVDPTGNDWSKADILTWISVGLGVVGVVAAAIALIPALAGIAVAGTTVGAIATIASLVLGIGSFAAGIPTFIANPSWLGGIGLALAAISLIPALGWWGVAIGAISVIIGILTAQVIIPAVRKHRQKIAGRAVAYVTHPKLNKPSEAILYFFDSDCHAFEFECWCA
jgi:RHS repeat-associated protein